MAATLDLHGVPEEHHEAVRTAVSAAFGRDPLAVTPVPGGASGALTFRIDAATGSHLLRLEARPPTAMRNPHQYACMQIAADAGIAPQIRYLDADAGIVVMPFIQQRPLDTYPGGPPALAAAAGTLLRRLHDTQPFPSHGDYLDNLSRLLSFVATNRVAPGLLDRHLEGLQRIRDAYPWHPGEFVSAHNDPNQFNLLFDGDRLWLIDWETASLNDPFIDLATVAAGVGTTPDLRTAVLRHGLGAEPTPADEARMALAGLLVQLFAGTILVLLTPASDGNLHQDLSASTPTDFQAAIDRGELTVGSPAATLAFAKTMLAAFADGVSTAAFHETLVTAGRT